jgi:hypothetical protein
VFEPSSSGYILAEMDWQTFVNGKRRKTSGDALENAAIAAYKQRR